MPTAGYLCNVCNRFFTDYTQAEVHEQIPVKDPFNVGLILKNLNVGNYYSVLESKGRPAQGSSESEAKAHDITYRVSEWRYQAGLRDKERVIEEDKIGFYQVSELSASQIERRILEGNLGSLSEDEFSKLLKLWKEQGMLEIVLKGDLEEKLSKDVPSLSH